MSGGRILGFLPCNERIGGSNLTLCHCVSALDMPDRLFTPFVCEEDDGKPPMQKPAVIQFTDVLFLQLYCVLCFSCDFG